MEVLPLLILANLGLAVLIVVAPLAVAAPAFYLLRRGISFKSAILFSAVPLSLLFVWPLTGLSELSRQCERTYIVHSNSKKIGPIDALLIVGRGSLWWVDRAIDIEMPERPNGEPQQFWRIEKRTSKAGHKALSETELRSRYRLTISLPQGGNFLQRYGPMESSRHRRAKVAALAGDAICNLVYG